MKKITLGIALLTMLGMASCAETTQKDNATKDVDTMVITDNKTDSATTTISTDTAKR